MRKERTIDKVAEFSQKVDKGVIVVSLAGVFFGFIPIGVATTAIALSIATFYGADALKSKDSKSSSKVVYQAA